MFIYSLYLLIVYLAPDPDQNQLFTIRGWIDGVVKHLELKGRLAHFM